MKTTNNYCLCCIGTHKQVEKTPKYISWYLMDIEQLYVITENKIKSAMVEQEYLDSIYKLLLECYDGVYDYIFLSLTADEKKAIQDIQLPSYVPYLFTKNFGSTIFSEQLFHPYLKQKGITRKELDPIQNSLFTLNEAIRSQSREKRSKDIFIEYLKKLNQWLHIVEKQRTGA